MTVAETLLVFVVAPLAVVAVLAALTLRPDPKARRRRYRPGQPWEHEALWYSPHTGALEAGHGAADGHGTTRGATALTAGAPVAGRGGPLGGARGTW